MWCVFVCTWWFDNSFILENSCEAKKVKFQMALIFHFISHIFIWKQHHLWTIECEKIKSVNRWRCFHMKIWGIKWKIRAIQDLTFLTSHEFSKMNELSNHHAQTKTHHMKLFLGLNFYHLKIPKIVHCDMLIQM